MKNFLFFNQKYEAPNQINQDELFLLNYLEDALESECIPSPISLDTFQNPKLATAYNAVLEKQLTNNHKYTMNLNNAMNIIGNAMIVQKMLHSVEMQNESLNHIQKTGDDIRGGVTNISSIMQNMTHSMNHSAAASKISTHNITQSMLHVNDSYENIKKIDEMVYTFKENTQKIDEIVTIVKNIANQTNLLSLNASIEAARAGEAGKGFAVVASEVKNLAATTKQSTEDISSYIDKLIHDVDTIASSLNDALEQIHECNKEMNESISEINQISEYIQTMNADMNSINTQISLQDESMSEFINIISKLNHESSTLNAYCLDVGKLMFQSSRIVDACRGNMARYTCHLTPKEWCEIFKVDHLIYTWRAFNHIYGFEKLLLNNINNPNTCKLGRWYSSITDSKLLNNSTLRSLIKNHEALHSKIVASFNASEEGDKKLALQLFEESHPILNQLLNDLDELSTKLPG